jgi:hypothetical protein
MNELEVKEILLRAAAAPRAPVPDRAAVIALGHRARRRQTIRWAGTGAATIVVAAVVGVLAIGAGPARTAPPQPGSTHHGPTATAPPSVPTRSPGVHYDQAYADQLLTALSALVPASFTLPTDDLFTDSAGQHYQVRGAQVSTDGTTGSVSVGAGTTVYHDQRQAYVSITVVPTSQPADLCAAEVRHQGVEAGCHVGTATNGTRIRVAWRDVGSGRIWYATRYVGGTSVTVQQSPGGIRLDLPAYDGGIWDEAGLVNVAADPSLAP